MSPEGFRFEMGGTWVHHTQAYMFRELHRYNMNHEVIRTSHRGYDNDYASLNVTGETP